MPVIKHHSITTTASIKHLGKNSFMYKYMRNPTDIKLCISHKNCLFMLTMMMMLMMMMTTMIQVCKNLDLKCFILNNDYTMRKNEKLSLTHRLKKLHLKINK